ncbi:MAG: ATP-binding protein [Psychrilyobacter sp.]|uniref:tRNA lysidine(34) synthetase n=1 Tax=Psychrilyobacter sp. TaxID=2586924 RepID=UPI003C730247
MKIERIEDLDNLKYENFRFQIIENELIIKNIVENFEIKFSLSEKKRIKITESIEKFTGLKLSFSMLEGREIISYIESKGFNKSIWSLAGKAMCDYNMVEEGDRIAVGVSGGKDSLTLLNVLVRVKMITRVNFEIIPIHIHPKQKSIATNEIEDYCKSLGLELIVEETNLEDILFGKNKMKNPCFMCGRMRRGILYRMMKEKNINKLALGHHKDDIIETFLLNTFYQGNLGVMKPKYMSKEHGVEVIRPMAYIEESTIIKYAQKIKLPILKSECKYETSKDSKRLEVKEMIEELSKKSENIRSVILNSIKPLLAD